MADMFTGFSFAALPDAIDAFRFHVDAEGDPSGIERYARRLFREIDVPRLRAIVDAHEVNLARIARMDAFYINYDHNTVSTDDALVILQVEAVLNRLAKLSEQVGPQEPSEEACSVLDMRSFRRVTAGVSGFLSEAGERNQWSQPGTIRCVQGGEWDIRTRLASMCELISPITRLDYRFDYDCEAGAVTMRFVCPDESAMPHSVSAGDGAAWREIDPTDRGLFAREHASRIALVLAAAAFSASALVERCFVEGRDARHPERTFCIRFDRAEYLNLFVPFSTELLDRPLSEQVCFHALARLTTEGPAPVTDAHAACWVPTAEDRRPLPPRLRELLLADSIADLNVLEAEDDPAMARLNAIRDLAARDQATALAQLVDLIGGLEASCALAELSSPAPLESQFCENYLGRLILPLLENDPSTRIHRAPDALYFAQYELASAYQRAGDLESALGEARKLLDLAATSTQAHFLLVNVLARLGRFDELIEVCRHGLRVAYDRGAVGYYFYRMAFAYWNLGDSALAAACYTMVPVGEQISQVAQMELATLLTENACAEGPTFAEAVAAVRAAGIPVAPTEEMSDRIADVAVLLTDHGFFSLAAKCVNYLWHVMGSDEMGALGRSLLPPCEALDATGDGAAADVDASASDAGADAGAGAGPAASGSDPVPGDRPDEAPGD